MSRRLSTLLAAPSFNHLSVWLMSDGTTWMGVRVNPKGFHTTSEQGKDLPELMTRLIEAEPIPLIKPTASIPSREPATPPRRKVPTS